MDLLQKFNQYVLSERLFGKTDKLVLAVSGGVDSVVLCELCKRSGFDFVIVHCNFQLRGEESARDENFVRVLATKYEVEFFIKKFDTEIYAKENKLSIQVAARDLRYSWFNEILQSPNPHILQSAHPHILTAHHANDNIETLLMNFFKGTGIAGLRSIQPKQNNIVRPLLFALKQDLRNFAKENSLDFVEDSSNLSDKYTRNYFRNQLIPSITKVYPEVEQNLIENISRFRDIEILSGQSVSRQKKKLVVEKGKELRIPVRKLMKTEAAKTILYEILKDYAFTPHQIHFAMDLLVAASGKYIKSASHRLLKDRDWLILTPIDHSISENILIEEGDKEIRFPDGILIFTAKTSSREIDPSPSSACLDAALITFPLLMRKWKQGDYFYPLGMNKKKKLSRFAE